MHENKEKSLTLAQAAIDAFDSVWEETYYGIMCQKIGFENTNPTVVLLVDELLDLMKKQKLDYTNTFWALSQEIPSRDSPINRSYFNAWLEKWKATVENSYGSYQTFCGT